MRLRLRSGNLNYRNNLKEYINESKFIYHCISLLLTVCSCSTPKSEMSTLVNNSLQTATVQSKLMAEDLLNEEGKLPRTIGKDGKLMTSKSNWWTSGFFPVYYGICTR